MIGNWTGTHSNGFGGSGPVSLVVAAVGNNVTLTVDVDGSVFGAGNPAPFVLNGVFNGAQAVFNDPANLVYGNLTVTVQINGSATVTFNNAPANPAFVVSGSSTGNIRNVGDPRPERLGFPLRFPL